MLIAAVAAQAAVAFTPPLDRPFDVVTTEVREHAGRTLRFEIRRRVTFVRTGGGLSAVVETIAVTDDAGQAGAMFTAMMRGMIGRTIVLRLDAAGRAVDVDDLDRQWTARTDAFAAGLSRDVDGPKRRAMATAVITALRATPRAERIARFAEAIVPIVAELPVRAGERRAVSVPGRAHDGSAVTLTGVERTTLRDRTVVLDREARGAVGGAGIEMVVRRTIDPATGLVLVQTERTVTDTPAGPSTITRTAVIANLVS